MANVIQIESDHSVDLVDGEDGRGGIIREQVYHLARQRTAHIVDLRRREGQTLLLPQSHVIVRDDRFEYVRAVALIFVENLETRLCHLFF